MITIKIGDKIITITQAAVENICELLVTVLFFLVLILGK